MFIKSLTIKGFKSFQDETVMGPFHLGVNVVVGRNGSGKSNVFKAIAFVMSDEFSNLRNEQRAALLFQSNKSDMTAWVQIVFDNTDQRFPTDRDEVVIRRTIGLKKDEYFLDNKHVTRSDISNLLESAGFSKSNPYYIVRQGEIRLLTTMKDADRLELLKEVAGTKVYDERKKESLKLMEEAEEKVTQISESLEFLEKRLAELESEKKELTEYQTLDKKRRVLEYTLHNTKLNKFQDELAEIDSYRGDGKGNLMDMQAKKDEMDDRKKALEKDIKTLAQQIQREESDLEVQRKEEEDLRQQKAQLELELEESTKRGKKDTEARKKHNAKLAQVESGIKEKQALLDKLSPELEAAQTQLNEAEKRFNKVETRMESLNAKQGRKQQFRNAKERDTWVKGQIKDLDAEISRSSGETKANTKEVAALEKSLVKTEKEIAAKMEMINTRGERASSLNAELKGLMERQRQTRDKVLELQRLSSQLEDNALSAQDALTRSEDQLNRKMPPAVSSGLKCVQAGVKELGLGGKCFGPVIELFTCKEAFFTAVDVTAGNQLFSIVVDNDDTAQKLLEYVVSRKQGRVTFLPLNKLQPSSLPAGADFEGSVPLIQYLKFHKDLKPAMEHVFGKTLVCRDLRMCSTMRQKFNCDCVTPGGDKTARKGTITGGFIEEKATRLKLQSTITDARKSVKAVQDESEQARSSAAAAEAEAVRVSNEYQKAKASRGALPESNKEVQLELEHLRSARDGEKERLHELQMTITKAGTELEKLQDRRGQLEKELGADLNDRLSAAEAKELEELTSQHETLLSQTAELTRKQGELSSKVAGLEDTLTNNLIKQREQLQGLLSTMNVAQGDSDSQQSKSEMAALDASLKQADERRQAVESQLFNNAATQKQRKDELEKIRSEEGALHQQMESANKDNERMLTKRSAIIEEQRELRAKIRDLGALPEDAYRGTSDKSVKQIHKELQSVNEKLKKYQHVNKKALEQYASFTVQRDQFKDRLDVSKKGAAAIQSLVKNLDEKKDNAIELTFKLVAKNFQDVFPKIVAGGTGSLVMRYSDDEGGEGTVKSRSGRTYTGICVKVKFPGHNEEVKTMNQLSGGQQTVVALAFIFAIQRNDPAPFYIFDEVDAALDPTYRSAIAKLIEEQAGKTQFFVTTFQPEFVKTALQHWFVSITNKVSKVELSDMEMSLRIVAQVQQEVASRS